MFTNFQCMITDIWTAWKQNAFDSLLPGKA